MERVTFLIEETGQRIACLLNPEGVVVRRRAGVQERRSVAGLLTGTGLADDALLFTGGGRTELELDLLFDTSLAPSTTTTDVDVQHLTRPLWDLAENVTGPDGFGRMRTVRLVWGKSWNVQGVVTAIAERFERFDASGVPQRSWMRMCLTRVGGAAAATATVAQPAAGFSNVTVSEDLVEGEVIIHEVVGGPEGRDATGAVVPGERLDEIASRYYGEPSLWRVLAAYNGIADPTRIPPPRTLRIPPLNALRNL
jgi:contractile injection system tube protein